MLLVRQCSIGLILIGWLTSAPFAGAQSEETVPQQQHLPGVIFIANGSGGGLEMTNGVWKAVARSPARFWVETIHWSRFQSAPRDHDDHIGQIAGARRLANAVLEVHRKHPGRKIFLVGFSSGARVVLEAGKFLPSNSVDRISVFAASVAYFYDLRPALRASREGIDNFYSYEDAILEGVVSLIGTADGYRVPAAGRFGFWLPSKSSPAFVQYQQKLRQYPYHSALAWTGHRGNHLDWTRHTFLQAYLLPKLIKSDLGQ